MFLLLSEISVFLNKTMSFFMNNTLFWFALLNWDNATNVITLCHQLSFFHFTYYLNHNLNMIVNDFIFKTGVFSVSFFSFLNSFAFCWNEKVSSPFAINFYWFVITKIGACRIPLLSIFTWSHKKSRLILLLIRENDVSWHFITSIMRLYIVNLLYFTLKENEFIINLLLGSE